MKIMFSTVILGTGGAERFATTLANKYSDQGNEVIILCSYKDPNFHYFINPNIKIYEILPKNEYKNGMFHYLTLIKRIHKVRSILKTERPDVLFTIYFNNSIQDLISSIRLGISVISGERDAFFLNESEHKKRARKLFYKFFSGFIYQTEFSKCELEKYNTRGKPSIVLKNPLFVAEYKDNVEICSRKEIVCAGRLDKNKNFSGVIKAFAEIAGKYNDHKLIIYGEGSERNNLEKEIRALNLEEKVILPGISTDIIDSFSGASCFILFSFKEGYPNVLLEAMAIGVPVISSDCPVRASVEMIENEKSGIIVEVDDIIGLSKSIDCILGNKNEAKKMAITARRVRKTNNIDKISIELFDFMKSTLVKNK